MARLSNVVLVYEEPTVRAVLVDRMRREGATVRAVGLEEVLDAARATPCDLLAIALAAEDSDALEAVRTIVGQGVVVIALVVDDASRKAAAAAGAQTLEYPFFLDVIAFAATIAFARRSRSGEGSSPFQGELTEEGPLPFLRALAGLRADARLRLERVGRVAEIEILGGKIGRARTPYRMGEEALYRLLLWREGAIEISFEQPDVESVSQLDLLEECERFLRDLTAAVAPLGALSTVLVQDRARLPNLLPTLPGKVSELLKGLGDSRTVAEVLEDSPFGFFDTIRILLRLTESRALARKSGLSSRLSYGGALSAFGRVMPPSVDRDGHEALLAVDASALFGDVRVESQGTDSRSPSKIDPGRSLLVGGRREAGFNPIEENFFAEADRPASTAPPDDFSDLERSGRREPR